jgi:hypothetical protein
VWGWVQEQHLCEDQLDGIDEDGVKSGEKETLVRLVSPYRDRAFNTRNNQDLHAFSKATTVATMLPISLITIRLSLKVQYTFRQASTVHPVSTLPISFDNTL